MLTILLISILLLVHSLAHVHTQKGEWVAYDFTFDQHDLDTYALDNGKLPVQVTVRAAGPPGKDRNVDLKIYTDYGSLVHEKTLTIDGDGYQNFMDRTWSGIRLDPDKRKLRLFVFFVAGNTNLCSVSIGIKKGGGDHPGGDDDDDDDKPVDKYIPFAVNALDYDDALELDDAVKGQCKIGQPPIDEPDAQTTSDTECKKLGPCNIAFTYDGEAVLYSFKSGAAYEETHTNGKKVIYVDITVRVASARKKDFAMEVETKGKTDAVEYFKTTGQGFQDYANIVWRKVPLDASSNIHNLIVTFTQGQINMCSVSVEYSSHGPAPHPAPQPAPHPVPHPAPHPVPTPGVKPVPPVTFAALDFIEAYETTPKSEGNCPAKAGVDAKYTNDKICMDRDDAHCFVGWTEPGGT